MRVYFDTGVFIDYLSARGSANALRLSTRRGRTPSEIAADAEQLFEKTHRAHPRQQNPVSRHRFRPSALVAGVTQQTSQNRKATNTVHECRDFNGWAWKILKSLINLSGGALAGSAHGPRVNDPTVNVRTDATIPLQRLPSEFRAA